MDENNELISREELCDKLIEPIKTFSGLYDADKEYIYQFSLQAPIKLIQSQLNNFDYNDCMETAVQYIRNPDAKQFIEYK